MKAPAIKFSGTGVLVLVGLAIVGYMVYKLYGAAGKAYANAEDALLNTIVPDANKAVQTQTQQELAELRAAGSPPVGSPLYNSIVAKYNPSQVVINSLSSGG